MAHQNVENGMAKPNNNAMKNEEKALPTNNCCFGPCQVHVEKGALVIATIGIVWHLLNLIVGFLLIGYIGHISVPTIFGVIFGTAAAVAIHASIIYAQKRANPALYLPYLVIMGLGMVSLGIATISCALMAAFMQAIFLLFALLLNAYFYSVVYRAYKYMKLGQSSY